MLSWQQMKQLALDFQAVSKNYGKLQALKKVNLQISEGQFLALLGPNGAGKTTLINCLSGVTLATSGEILVQNKNIKLEPEFTKTAIGVMAQEITFDPFFTPLEVLQLQRGLYGLPPDNQYIDWLLEQVALSDKRHSRGRQLSGGMKRRLMMAKALAHKPKILILDEPTAGVDIELRKQLWNLVDKLRKDWGLTIILTTHYLEEAEALAERVVILNKGGIVLDQPCTKLMQKYRKLEDVFLEAVR